MRWPTVTASDAAAIWNAFGVTMRRACSGIHAVAPSNSGQVAPLDDLRYTSARAPSRTRSVPDAPSPGPS